MRAHWNAEHSSGGKAGPLLTLQHHFLSQQSERRNCDALPNTWKGRESLRLGKKSPEFFAPALPGAELAPKTNPARSPLKLLPDGKNSKWRHSYLVSLLNFQTQWTEFSETLNPPTPWRTVHRLTYLMILQFQRIHGNIKAAFLGLCLLLLIWFFSIYKGYYVFLKALPHLDWENKHLWQHRLIQGMDIFGCIRDMN